MADTDFTIGLGVTGAASADSAAASLAALADRLTSAGAASDAATAALKAGQAAYNQAETGADRAAKALERIGVAADLQRGKLAAALETGDARGVETATAKLANLAARQTEATAKAAAATSAMNAEAVALDKLKSAAATAADNEAKLTKEHAAAAKASKDVAKNTDDAGKAAGGGAVNFRALSGALGKLGGPLGSIGGQAAGVGGAIQKMSKALGAAGPYVAAAVLAAALAASFVVASLAITHFAITSADAARTAALLSDGIAGSVKGGRELDKTIDSLGTKVPQTREELLGMAGDLAKTGLSGAALSSALEDAATKAAKIKYGPDFQKQTLSITNQTARLHSNIAGLFNGLNIEKLLEGFAKLVALFDSSEASGKAIKVVFDSLFQPIVDGLTAMIPKAVSAFLQLEILALKAMIAIKPYGSKLQEIAEVFGHVAGVLAGDVAAALVLLVTGSLAAGYAIGKLIEAGMWVGNVMYSIGAAVVGGAGSAFDWLSAKVSAVVDFLSGLSLSSIGSMLIQGLIDGIKGAAGGVLTAVTGIATGAVTAAKKALGIASPSKVFAEIGMYTGEGMAQGVDKSSDAVQGSLESMVSPPAAPAAAAAPTSSTSGKGSMTGAVFNFYGVEGAQDAQDRFLSMLEGFQAQGGTAAANAA